jgi:hypothetical protein
MATLRREDRRGGKQEEEVRRLGKQVDMLEALKQRGMNFAFDGAGIGSLTLEHHYKNLDSERGWTNHTKSLSWRMEFASIQSFRIFSKAT